MFVFGERCSVPVLELNAWSEMILSKKRRTGIINNQPQKKNRKEEKEFKKQVRRAVEMINFVKSVIDNYDFAQSKSTRLVSDYK